jgi:hypothetical protein
MKIKIYRNIILPAVLYGCETWSLTLREENRLNLFENRVLSRIFGLDREEVRGEWSIPQNGERNDLYSPNNRVIKSSRMRWAGHVSHMGKRRGYTGFWWGDLREEEQLEDPRVNGSIYSTRP